MKPLDFVRTPKGGIALVRETNNGGRSAAIEFVDGNPHRERCAWWDAHELTVTSSLPLLLANGLAHPFGRGRSDAAEFFGEAKR